MLRVRAAALVLTSAIVACVPRLAPLTGAPMPADRMPHANAPAGRHTIVFSWEYEDREMTGRGDGAARIAAPDSARLDFYLAMGLGSGAAVLIGDSLQVPGGVDLVRRLVPPPPLLWATLGRVALPNLPDTAVRSDGGILRADIGRPVAWRVSFHGDTLFRAERVDNGRVVEWVERTNDGKVRYRNEGTRRSLTLTITRTNEVSEFDASIWHFDR
jgi:hypothetical protein